MEKDRQQSGKMETPGEAQRHSGEQAEQTGAEKKQPSGSQSRGSQGTQSHGSQAHGSQPQGSQQGKGQHQGGKATSREKQPPKQPQKEHPHPLLGHETEVTEEEQTKTG